MKPIFGIIAGIVAGALTASPAAAIYPDHPVKVIVPYAAGGPTDVTARLVAQKLGERLGQTFIVDNRGGAGGNIGTREGAASAADGYTLIFITPAQVINQTFYANPGYDLSRDFAPIALLTTAPALLIAHPSLNVRTLGDLIALAKSQPGKISYASQGVGVAPHLMMEMLKQAAGIDLVHVPYRGSAPALNDVLAGTVPLMMDSIITGLPHVKSGALRGIAVSTAERTPLAPEIPTIAESGIGFNSSLWYGIVAPVNAPPDILRRLSAEIAAVMAMTDVRERLLSFGAEPGKSDPPAFAAFLDGEAVKWGGIVRSLGLKTE